MEIKKILIKAGYKLTKPRLAVLGCLERQDKLLSARAIYQKIKTVDQASVYRTLNLFEELDIVNSETIDKEKLYCLAGHPHHHIICRTCGYSESIECKHKFTHKHFTDINHQLLLSGFCRKCS